jgi:histidinol-phosphatase (PHP family)
MKVDGHTHTQYCPHGSGEDTELFIQKAIELGFDTYTVSEHPPLPKSFIDKLPYKPKTIESLCMKEHDLDNYIREMHKLKEKYRDVIQIKVGLEIDYLPEYTDWTKNLLNEYGTYLDDGLLSIHFLKGSDCWRCVDLDPEDFNNGLVKHYSSFKEVQMQYYKTLEEALFADLGPYKPKRIGHLTLCQKFQRYFKEDQLNQEVKDIIEHILHQIKKMKCSLDYNMAGLFKPYCLEPYPSYWIVNRCRQLGIQLIYGSDAHAVNELGRGYNVYARNLSINTS